MDNTSIETDIILNNNNQIKYLSKYAFVQCVISRAKDIENSIDSKIDSNCKFSDPVRIAIWELKNRKYPYLVKLFLNTEQTEFIIVDPKNCILPDF
jgi:DNA-directed RNA polymerase subunit K/omega